MRYLIFCIFLLMYCGCTNNKIKIANKANTTSIIPRDTTLKILTYGLLDMERHRAMNTVAKKYGFKFIPVAGCVVSKELIDSIQTENDKTNSLLQTKLGRKWKDKFWVEVDTIQVLQAEVEKIVKREKYIIKKEDELSSNNNGLYFDIVPNDNNIFYVNAYSWVTDSTSVIFYKMSVDLKHKFVTLLNSTPENR